MNASDFHLSKCLISISWNPIAYRVVHAPTRRECADHIWSSALFLTGSKLKRVAAAVRIAVLTRADVMFLFQPWASR